MITILPSYYCINILAAIIGNYNIDDILLLQPIELVGIQTWYETLFGIFHNGGTWFVSCILLCYFIYPIINQLLKNARIKYVLFFLIGVLFLDSYSIIIRARFGLADSYSSPLFRMIEFIMGICIGRLWIVQKEKLQNINIIFFIVAAFTGVILVGIESEIITGAWTTYFIKTDICVLVYSLSLIIFNIPKWFQKIILAMAGICYDIYLVQCIIWFPYGWLTAAFPIILTNNKYMKITGILLLIGLSLSIHLIVEKPIQSFLRKKLAESECK